MTIKRYAGDKITGVAGDSKPTTIADGATFYETDTLKTYMKISGTWTLMSSAYGSIEFIVDGGGATITTGVKGDIEVPFACTVTTARMFADQSGSITVSIWKDTYANFPPVVGDLMDTYILTTTTKYEETGLALTIAAGSVLRFNVDSATTIQRCTVSLTIKKT